MIPTVSQVCSLESPLEKDFEDYSAGHCRSVELWLTKVERWIEQNSLEAFLQLRERCEIVTPAASFQGGLLATQGERRAESWRLFRRRLELCQALGVGTLVVACDVPPPLDQETLERVRVSLQQVAAECARHGVRGALEFQAGAGIGNNLPTAIALTAEAQSPFLGICLDAFHFHCGPSKSEDLGLLTAENLFHVQLCDIADTPRELARDSDRIFPGEGEIHLAAIIERLRQIDYRGAVSLELLNPQLWCVPALQLGEIGITCLRGLLGLWKQEA
jgi:2-keto-myo-inositol isomerase